MEGSAGEQESAFRSALPPAVVSLTPLTSSVSPSPRRLSICSTRCNQPVRAKRQLAWASRQVGIIGAEKATAVKKTIERHILFTDQEATASEILTPIQRALIVSVVAAAAINSKKHQQISSLQNSVEIRDQVLESMQQKIDSLFQQVSSFNNQSQDASAVDLSAQKPVDSRQCEPFHHHISVPSDPNLGNTSIEGPNRGKVFVYRVPAADMVEAEERHLSYWSDSSPSISSSMDNQFDTGAMDHDATMPMKNSKHNDVSINHLSAFIRSSEIYVSKRIAKLEDTIGRKNAIINKLRRDIVILERKTLFISQVSKD
ncbi:uncharacterized protein LOC127259278 isoform X2 [Andrographis paniculata]|uniref:uncharacterized protein LOC127259278 isoform X2 n=1 Tax=Andrographis paniculata TaxID=175694 RepID=UPI0021E804CD|nr:uncharacterized protein LOC127259278 isoform X2 [Andrographis paniculata]